MTRMRLDIFHIIVAPDKYKSRDRWAIFNWLGFSDEYRCAFDIHEVNVYHDIPATIVPVGNP